MNRPTKLKPKFSFFGSQYISSSEEVVQRVETVSHRAVKRAKNAAAIGFAQAEEARRERMQRDANSKRSSSSEQGPGFTRIAERALAAAAEVRGGETLTSAPVGSSAARALKAAAKARGLPAEGRPGDKALATAAKCRR